MAVIKGLPGLVVGITCNGETLAEYSDPEERKAKPRTVTKFIESQTDANFQIEYCYDAAKFRRNKKDHYELHLYLDGQCICQHTHEPSRIEAGGRRALAGVCLSDARAEDVHPEIQVRDARHPYVA